ncbi:hypothetical protein IFM61392_10086 [Aspergillus lentulus]|nr:hypothetical protein IFM61392_10086 [Aspergillus lentulus]
MPLLSLPTEILFLVTQKLDHLELWSAYDTCRTLRLVSAPSLFRNVNIVFDNPPILNFRLFRSFDGSLIGTLKQWAVHVRAVEIWGGDEESLQTEFFDLLPLFDRLEAFRHAFLANYQNNVMQANRDYSIGYPPDFESFQQLLAQLATIPSMTTLSVEFMSPRTWMLPMSFKHLRNLQLSCIEHEPGLCVLPDLPSLVTLALNFSCFCPDCPRGVSGAQEGSIICCGQARRLRRFEVSFSSGLEWATLLQCLGPKLEAIEISSCEFAEESLVSIGYPSLRSVRILDSTSNILLFCEAELPCLNDFTVHLHPEDLDNLTSWPHIKGDFNLQAITWETDKDVRTTSTTVGVNNFATACTVIPALVPTSESGTILRSSATPSLSIPEGHTPNHSWYWNASGTQIPKCFIVPTSPPDLSGIDSYTK